MATAEIANLIAGERRGTPTCERRNPADRTDVVAVSVSSTPEEVDDAVAAAAAAAKSWANTPPPARGRILLDAADLLRKRLEAVALDLTREEGKTIGEARGEVARAADVFRYFGSEAWRFGGFAGTGTAPESLVYTRREPLGVVGIITPWNFPIAIPAWKIAPALVAGNTVVIKPAELTPLSVHHLLEALIDAGLPSGVANVVYGAGRVAGHRLVSDERVAGLTFTGSTLVGTEIRSVLDARGARIQLEMGGKNALVVLDDSDPAFAAELAAIGGFRGTGQACTATSRVICTERAYDAFVEALLREAERYRPGDGQDESVLMGPVVNDAQLEKDIAAVRDAIAEGANVLSGSADARDLFFDPTVVVDVDARSPLVTEEIFGPVIGVLKVPDLGAAIDLVNDSKYGLSAGVCTDNIVDAMRFAEQANVGVVKINQPTTGLDINVPFGGVKASSSNTYREQGPTAIDFCTWTKTVYLAWRGP